MVKLRERERAKMLTCPGSQVEASPAYGNQAEWSGSRYIKATEFRRNIFTFFVKILNFLPGQDLEIYPPMCGTMVIQV